MRADCNRRRSTAHDLGTERKLLSPSIQQLMTDELGDARKLEIQQLLTAKFIKASY
jgi:hypothetical protein